MALDNLERDRIWNAAIDAAAKAVEDQDRTGREWVPKSLWHNIYRRFSPAIRNLKRPMADNGICEDDN